MAFTQDLLLSEAVEVAQIYRHRVRLWVVPMLPIQFPCI